MKTKRPITVIISTCFALLELFLNGSESAVAEPNPTSVEQALTSYQWSVQPHEGEGKPPREVHFYPNGTTDGEGGWRWHWVATGPRTFNLNGNTPCTFDQTFSKFIGQWSNKRGVHTTTGIRMGLAASTAPDSVTHSIGSAPGQPATPSVPPKKDPFAGFGSTGLDHPGGGTGNQGAFNNTPLPQMQAEPENVGTAGGSPGIVLSNAWVGHLTEASGGQTVKMNDLSALLSGYGLAVSDTGRHPDVTVYEGPTLDSGSSQNCRITYLMPLGEAERLLLRSRGITTVTRAVAPGFPDGLFIHTYDIKAGFYNRLSILTDSANPEQQVVSLLLTAEGANWYPPSPPFKKLTGDWHTHDYMNTENKGQPGLVIDTRVNDQRRSGHYIIVNTTGGREQDFIPSPGILLKPARFSPKEDVTWYLPEPFIKLILFSLKSQMGH